MNRELKSRKREVGFEPTINGFAVRRLILLAIPVFRENWSERQGLNLRTLASKASPYSHLRNAQKITEEADRDVRAPTDSNWLRGKGSNLHLLSQSQASCQLDDPEIPERIGFVITRINRKHNSNGHFV